MSDHTRLAPLLLGALLMGCSNGGANKEDDDIIAPNCDEAWCAEVEIDVTMSCEDPLSEQSFSVETSIQGLTRQLSCWGEENASGGMDLGVGVGPADGQSGGNFSEVGFRIRNYDGPGTYELFNVEGEGNHEGLIITGNPDDTEIPAQTVGTVACRTSTCEAIVSENSDSIPTDPYSVHEFRVRVEVVCPAGASLGNFLCDDDATICSFTKEPTLHFDLLCAN